MYSEPEFLGGHRARHRQHIFGALQGFFESRTTIRGNFGCDGFQFTNDTANKFLGV